MCLCHFIPEIIKSTFSLKTHKIFICNIRSVILLWEFIKDHQLLYSKRYPLLKIGNTLFLNRNFISSFFLWIKLILFTIKFIFNGVFFFNKIWLNIYVHFSNYFNGMNRGNSTEGKKIKRWYLIKKGWFAILLILIAELFLQRQLILHSI